MFLVSVTVILAILILTLIFRFNPNVLAEVVTLTASARLLALFWGFLEEL